jgi:selenoprotein W-related protein
MPSQRRRERNHRLRNPDFGQRPLPTVDNAAGPVRCAAMHEGPAGATPGIDVTAEGAARPERPRVAITYCTQCNWLLRSAWMAQELLSTFRDDLGEVALIPATGGTFRIEIGSSLLWERVRDGGFPDVKALKQRVRDCLDPARDLGHIDRP